MPVEYGGGGGGGDVSGSEDDEMPSEFAAMVVADKTPPKPPARAPSTKDVKPKARRAASRKLSRALSRKASQKAPESDGEDSADEVEPHFLEVARCAEIVSRSRRDRGAEMRPRYDRDVAFVMHGRWCSGSCRRAPNRSPSSR